MDLLHDPARRLRTVLWLMAAHSAAVGIALMLHPDRLLELAGYEPVGEDFFPVQGGVFHVIMAVGYGLGALDSDRRSMLIRFAVFVKSAALVFLVAYWLTAPRLFVVLASGLVDGAMAGVLFWAYRSWRRAGSGGGI